MMNQQFAGAQPQGPQQQPMGGLAAMGMSAPPQQGGLPAQAAQQFGMGDISNMSDPQLEQLAKSPQPGDQLKRLVALSEIDKRTKMRKEEQAKQAQQQVQGQPKTVAQGVLQQAAQVTGISGLPTGQAVPQQGYAGGGIVGFAEGGDTERPIGQFYGRADNPSERNRWLEYMESVRKGAMPVLASAADIASMVPRGLMGAGNAVIGGVRALGADVPYMKDVLAPEGSQFESATPWYDKYVRGNGDVTSAPSSGHGDDPSQQVGKFPGDKKTGPIGPAKRGDGTGIAKLAKKDDGYPDYVDPRAGVQDRVTEEQRDAMVKAHAEKLAKLYGPDVAQKYLDDYAKMRADIPKKIERNQNDAWMQAGIAALKGKSKYFSRNFGDAMEAYNTQQMSGRDKLEALDRELMAAQGKADVEMQGRNRGIVKEGIEGGNAQAGRADQKRAEDIANNEARQQNAIGKANFGLASRKVGAEELNAEAHMTQARASAAANGLAREANAITIAEKRIDAETDRLMALDPLAMADPAQAQLKRAQIKQKVFEKELNTNPAFAQLMGVAPRSGGGSAVGSGRTVSAASVGMN